jgi:hypothetical protein
MNIFFQKYILTHRSLHHTAFQGHSWKVLKSYIPYNSFKINDYFYFHLRKSMKSFPNISKNLDILEFYHWKICENTLFPTLFQLFPMKNFDTLIFIQKLKSYIDFLGVSGMQYGNNRFTQILITGGKT